MPTIVSHALVGYTLARVLPLPARSAKISVVAALAAMLPDADMLLHHWVAWNNWFSHRGLSHSLAFAVAVSVPVAWAVDRECRASAQRLALLSAFFALAIASHALLDACTNGGRGVALLAPFNWNEYFFRLRPLEVSPFWAGIFSPRGWLVAKSEMLWIGLPCLLLLSVAAMRRKCRRRRASLHQI